MRASDGQNSLMGSAAVAYRSIRARNQIRAVVCNLTVWAVSIQQGHGVRTQIVAGWTAQRRRLSWGQASTMWMPRA